MLINILQRNAVTQPDKFDLALTLVLFLGKMSKQLNWKSVLLERENGICRKCSEIKTVPDTGLMFLDFYGVVLCQSGAFEACRSI